MPCPKPLPSDPTVKQRDDHTTQMLSWWVGEHLRAMITAQQTNRELPDDYPLQLTPRYGLSSGGSGRRSTDGMERLITYIDAQSYTVQPCRRAYHRLANGFPLAAHVLLLRHIQLLTIPQISPIIKLSERQTRRLLHAAHLHMRANIISHDPDAELSRVDRVNFYRLAEQAEAWYHQNNQLESDIKK